MDFSHFVDRYVMTWRENDCCCLLHWYCLISTKNLELLETGSKFNMNYRENKGLAGY